MLIAWGVSWTVDCRTLKPVPWSRDRVSPVTVTLETVGAASSASAVSATAPATAAWAAPQRLAAPASTARPSLVGRALR